jgi:4-oxalocrotonate tautomerase
MDGGVNHMPLVQVHLWEGATQERVKTTICKITDVFVEMGIPAQAVQVLVYEVPKTNWGIGGEPCSEKYK